MQVVAKGRFQCEVLLSFFILTCANNIPHCERLWWNKREKWNYNKQIHTHTHRDLKCQHFVAGALTSVRALPLTSLTRLVSLPSHFCTCTSFPFSIVTRDYTSRETNTQSLLHTQEFIQGHIIHLWMELSTFIKVYFWDTAWVLLFMLVCTFTLLLFTLFSPHYI